MDKHVCPVCGETTVMTAWGESCKCSRRREKEWRKQLRMMRR